MILLAKASHIEKMMVQVQCGQDSRLPPVRIFNKERVITYRWEKLLRYSMQLSMLKQLLKLNLINQLEYEQIQKKLMRDYGIVSNITA